MGSTAWFFVFLIFLLVVINMMMMMIIVDLVRRRLLWLNTFFNKRREKLFGSNCLVDDDEAQVVLENCIYHYLPENCIYNILVRLPLETLICSSSLVCKSWYEIINSTDFKNAHLRRSDTRRGIIFSAPVRDHSSKKVFCPGSNSTMTNPNRTFHIKFMEFNKDGKKSRIKEYNTAFRGRIVAACDGLVVLEKCLPTRELMLLNPVTRELERIPTGTISAVRDGDLYGLAAAASSYKLLRLFIKDKEKKKLGCEIMDMVGRGGSWRAVDVPPVKEINYTLLHSPIFAMGALHWIQYVDVDDGHECLVSMPLDGDDGNKFKTTPIPPADNGRHHMRPYNTVFAMGGFLGLWSRDEENQIQVWIWRDDEWEKQYDIDASGLGYMTPLLYIECDDKLVLECGDKCFYAHDRHSGDLTKTQTINRWAAANNDCWTIFPHVNSLVSWSAR